MRYERLKGELQTDPLGRGYAGMGAEQVAADLNAKRVKQLRPLSSRELLKWAAGGADDATGRASRYERIQQAASQHASAAVRGVAYAAAKMLDREDTQLDFDESGIPEMVNALVAGGVLEVSEKTELETLATETVSRAEQLGLPAVGAGHVERARRQISAA